MPKGKKPQHSLDEVASHPLLGNSPLYYTPGVGPIVFYLKEEAFAFYANTFPVPFSVYLPNSDVIQSVDCVERVFQALKGTTHEGLNREALELLNDREVQGSKLRDKGRQINMAMEDVVCVDPDTQKEITYAIPFYDAPFDKNHKPILERKQGKLSLPSNPPYLTVKERIMLELKDMELTQNLPLLLLLLRDEEPIFEATERSKKQPKDSLWGRAPFPDGTAGRNSLGHIYMHLRKRYLNFLRNNEQIDVKTSFSGELLERLGVQHRVVNVENKVIDIGTNTQWSRLPQIQTFLAQTYPDAADYAKVARLSIDPDIIRENLRKDFNGWCNLQAHGPAFMKKSSFHPNPIAQINFAIDRTDPGEMVFRSTFRNAEDAVKLGNRIQYGDNPIENGDTLIIGNRKMKFMFSDKLKYTEYEAEQFYSHIRDIIIPTPQVMAETQDAGKIVIGRRPQQQ